VGEGDGEGEGVVSSGDGTGGCMVTWGNGVKIGGGVAACAIGSEATLPGIYNTTPMTPMTKYVIFIYVLLL
jgi:hypothetical protein